MKGLGCHDGHTGRYDPPQILSLWDLAEDTHKPTRQGFCRLPKWSSGDGDWMATKSKPLTVCLSQKNPAHPCPT